MKRILVYLKDYKKECVFAPLFKMLEATFELLVPLVVAAMIDQGIAHKDVPYIWKMGGILLLLTIVGLTCSITAQFFAAKAATGFSAKLKHALFSHIESLSFTEIDRLGPNTLITRMTSDVNQAQSGVNMVLRLFLRSPFIVFGAMVMAFTINVKAALVFVVTIPALSVVVFGLMYISIPLYKKVQAGLDKVLGITRENLTGVRVIRAFNKEEAEQEHFHEENQELTRLQLFVGRLSALMNPVTYVIVNVALIALIFKGAKLVDSDVITQGEVVALINYMSQILIELVKLANLIVTITKAVACANRLGAIFEMESSMKEGEAQFDADGNLIVSSVPKEDIYPENDCAVVFENVGLTYKNAKEESISDLNLKVKRGQTIGVIGGTGSGKTSFVHMIPRFYDASRGAVYVDGLNVKDYQTEMLRKKVGMVMQKAVLFKGSIRDNMKWGNENATDAEIMEALSRAQALEFVEKKDGGLDFKITEGGKNLSGGQKQRLTIARALVKQPEILIMDDSASALDFATDAKLRAAVREMGKTMTIFIVSQRTSSIMNADQIVVLDDGLVAGIGTHEELLQSSPVYAEIYDSQFKKEGR